MCPPANPPASPRVPFDGALRVFFALWPDVGVRDGLVTLAREVTARAGGRAPPPENLHLTLAFVGDVAAARVEVLCAIGGAAAVAVPAFRLSLDTVGAFRSAGIAWAGAAAIPGELAELLRRLDDGLAAAGFARERRAFHPHVTLARRCRIAGNIAIAAPISWTVARMTLNASELSPRAPRYRELAVWPLGRRPADAGS